MFTFQTCFFSDFHPVRVFKKILRAYCKVVFFYNAAGNAKTERKKPPEVEKPANSDSSSASALPLRSMFLTLHMPETIINYILLHRYPS